jgi:hypothetical protein
MTGPRDDAEAILAAMQDVHAWWPKVDVANLCHVWRCTCKNAVVYQPFGADVPAELNAHTRGQPT